MIFTLEICTQKVDESRNTPSYYQTLGMVYSLLGQQNNLKHSILSVSSLRFKNQDEMNINITIHGKESFNEIIDKIKDQTHININGHPRPILSYRFHTNVFQAKTKSPQYSQIDLHFLSPTIVKKEQNGIDINQLLPIPEVFLTSAVRKYQSLYNTEIDIERIKEEIKQFTIVSRFELSTRLVEIKGNKKAGVLGNIKYTILQGMSEETKQILYVSGELAKTVGLGTGNKLGLGKVNIFFNQ